MLVSILINNYNYGAFLQAAIDSALAQTYRPIEVVVVDDGSTDNSREILSGYGDRARLLLQENRGQAEAFNAGFRASTGEIICLLDSDDIFVPGKAQRLAALYESHPNAGWVFNECQLANKHGQPIEDPPGFGKCEGEIMDVDCRQQMITGRRLPYRGPATSGLSFRRDVLEKLLPLPKWRNIASEESLKFGAFYLVPGMHTRERLTLQRVHGANAYTYAEGIGTLKARIHLQVALYLREQFPETRRFADKLYARWLNRLVAAVGLEEAGRVAAATDYLDRHFHGASWWRCSSRAALNCWRLRQRRS